MKADCLFVANDPGSVNVQIPVIKELAKTQLKLICYVLDFGKEHLIKESIPFKTIDKSYDSKKIRRILKENQPSVLVAGHSYPQTILGQIERKFVQEASALEIFSVSIIDFWSNYRLRFSLSQGKILDALPNLICATDYSMKDELVKAGISKDRITVTGNPYLERLKDIKGDLAKQGKDSFRKNFRFEKDDIVIVFLSQPISIDSGKGKCGYDEDKIFKDVIRVLAGQKWADKVKVIWKPHPREKNKNIENQFSNIPLSIEEFKQGEIFELMAGSDLIIGAFTMLLVEAFLLGFCCISYQPNENNILKLPYKIKILKDSGSLEKFLNNKEFYTNQKDQTDQPSLISNSTEIIKNLILSHINH